jgi:putative transposase
LIGDATADLRSRQVILAHSIALDPTEAQEAYFRRACGTARFTYNWALAEWTRMHEAGEKPTAFKVKAAWNAHRKINLPWTYEVPRCVSGQAVIDLGAAFTNFLRDVRKPAYKRRWRHPQFKKKTRDNGFALWNDRLEIDSHRLRVPGLGWVKMHEPFRFVGKIMGAVVRRHGTRWHVSVRVEIVDPDLPLPPNPIVGVDLGISALMTLSQPLPDGRTKIANPSARRALMKRQKKLGRRISRQEFMRRKANGKTSQRQWRRRDAMRKLHWRVVSIRRDAINKATSLIASNFSTIVLEDLNVSGMAKNHSLAGSVLDAAFFEARRQFEYKTAMRGGRVVISNRYFPSSKTCSACAHVLDTLPLHRREWACPECGTVHGRDANAALNLELVGAAGPEPPADDRSDTRGEMEALATSQDVVKPLSANRELQPLSRRHLRNGQ